MPKCVSDRNNLFAFSDVCLQTPISNSNQTQQGARNGILFRVVCRIFYVTVLILDTLYNVHTHTFSKKSCCQLTVTHSVTLLHKGRVFLQFKVSLVDLNFPPKLNLNLQGNGTTQKFSVKTANVIQIICHNYCFVLDFLTLMRTEQISLQINGRL